MAETWLSWCILRDGPPSKQGYASAPSRTLAQIEGEVKHSMEGGLAAALGELDRPDRRASWTFSVARDGAVYQHYPLESITWTNGSLESNRRFVGIEHEGRAGEPLTEPQYQATLRLSREFTRLCWPNMAVPARPRAGHPEDFP